MKFETLSKLQKYVKGIYYVGLKHKPLYFQIQFINLLCSSEEMKVIKSKVALEWRLSFQKQKYVINAELKKKNHQSKLSAQNMSSVAKEEKLKKNEDRVTFFKYGKDHILFVRFVMIFLFKVCAAFFYSEL